MATVKNVLIKLHLSDGKTATITLPEARNDNLIDENEDTLVMDACRAMFPVYAADNGATIVNADFYVTTTTTSVVVEGLNAADL